MLVLMHAALLGGALTFVGVLCSFGIVHALVAMPFGGSLATLLAAVALYIHRSGEAEAPRHLPGGHVTHRG